MGSVCPRSLLSCVGLLVHLICLEHFVVQCLSQHFRRWWKRGADIRNRILIGVEDFFFAATVGFGVPEVKAGKGNMLDGEAFGKGCVLFLVAVVGKSFLAPFAIPLTGMEAAKFSFAMQGRGEFSFLIADAASEDNIYEGADFGSVVWGLLLTCIITPYGFVYVLSKEQGSKGASPDTQEPSKDAQEPEKVGSDIS